MRAERILFVDDEQAVRFGVSRYLEEHGYELTEADTCEAALKICRESPPDLAIVDQAIPDGTGVDLIPRFLAIDPELPIVILTGHASVELAVKAMSAGAINFLPKPVELASLLVIIKRILEGQQLRRREFANHSRAKREAIDPFVGTSAAIRKLFDRAKRIVAAASPILIQGETGVGKGVLARWLHQNGPSAEAAFVDLNCAGLSRDLVESELFGHEKGAFTGAVARKLGLFEVAHRGTVFLDEIGELDLAVQAKLLKVLEEQRFRRVGDVRDRDVNVRFIAATHRNILELVAQRQFRDDLYFRIATIPLIVPPLRERCEDIPVLAGSLLQRCTRDLGRSETTLSPDAIEALVRYPWPGNIRELRNVIERAVLLSDDRVLSASQLHFHDVCAEEPPSSVSMTAIAAEGPTSEPSSSGPMTLLAVERLHIERVLRECRGRVEDVAKLLGIPRSSLYQKIKHHGIVLPKSRSAI
jgi:DNA-binding NtrC family response regulator